MTLGTTVRRFFFCREVFLPRTWGHAFPSLLACSDTSGTHSRGGISPPWRASEQSVRRLSGTDTNHCVSVGHRQAQAAVTRPPSALQVRLLPGTLSARWSSGQGHQPLTLERGVRFPYGLLLTKWWNRYTHGPQKAAPRKGLGSSTLPLVTDGYWPSTQIRQSGQFERLVTWLWVRLPPRLLTIGPVVQWRGRLAHIQESDGSSPSGITRCWGRMCQGGEAASQATWMGSIPIVSTHTPMVKRTSSLATNETFQVRVLVGVLPRVLRAQLQAKR